MKKLISDKRGGAFLNVILIVGILFMIMITGLIIGLGGVSVKWAVDTIAPELTGLGMAGDANLSSIGTTVVTPIKSVVDSFSWLSGIVYFFAIILMLGLGFAFRMTGNKWLMAIFFACMFLLIIGSIFISNIYQDFYDDGREIGARLHEFALLSFLMLYSPIIMCVIGFVSGIIMFTGGDEENA